MILIIPLSYPGVEPNPVKLVKWDVILLSTPYKKVLDIRPTFTLLYIQTKTGKAEPMDEIPAPHPTPSEAPNFDGERYYLAAIALTDAHPGTQFREMLSHDAGVGQAARLYFQGEWRNLQLMGWNTFCLRMEETGQRDWLSKIKSLDNDVMLSHLEQQILTAQRSADKPNRSLLESAVKALQGVAAMTKIEADKQEMGSNTASVEIRFSGIDVNPITGQPYPGTPKTNDIDNIEPEESDD